MIWINEAGKQAKDNQKNKKGDMGTLFWTLKSIFGWASNSLTTNRVHLKSLSCAHALIKAVDPYYNVSSLTAQSKRSGLLRFRYLGISYINISPTIVQQLSQTDQWLLFTIHNQSHKFSVTFLHTWNYYYIQDIVFGVNCGMLYLIFCIYVVGDYLYKFFSKRKASSTSAVCKK